jgi:transposase
MDIITDHHHVSRLEVVDTGRRRRWTDAEKLRIIEESFAAPRLASAVARRHGLSRQQMFAWRKAYREGRLGVKACADPVPGFVAVRVVANGSASMAGTRGSGVSIDLGRGRVVRVEVEFDAGVLSRVLDVLEAR